MKTFEDLYTVRLRGVPSLRPPVYMLVDRKPGLEKYNWLALACWAVRECSDFHDLVEKFILFHVQFSGHVSCETKIDTILVSSICTIQMWNVIFPCAECKHLVHTTPVQLDSLTFEHIQTLENAQVSVAFPGALDSFSSARLTLADHISYFTQIKYRQKLSMPLRYLRTLKLKSSERLEMLGFGYASIYMDFMGNLSLRKPIDYNSPRKECITSFIIRWATTSGDEDYMEYDFPLLITNELGSPHFVSCGSRGIEPFLFVEFLSVFEWKVYTCLVISSLLVSITILKVYNNGGISVGIMSTCKLLLEQGNPFPAKIESNMHLRFLLAGTFLAGLVISNAFKSENATSSKSFCQGVSFLAIALMN